MTPEQIEAALEQPEFNNPLMELARARIALDIVLDTYEMALEGPNGEGYAEAMEAFDNREADFFEGMAGPFGETAGHEDAPEQVIKDYYNTLKATLLSPQHRLKEAIL